MLHGEALDTMLRGRRIARVALKSFGPFGPAGPVLPGDDAPYFAYLDLDLDDGARLRVWRGQEQAHEKLHVMRLTFEPEPDPDGVAALEVSADAPWASLIGAPIRAVEQEGGWVPRPAPRTPPEATGDDAFDAWLFGPEDWAVYLNSDDDPKETYVLRMLALELGEAGRLSLQAVQRPGASSLDPAAVLVRLIPGRAPGTGSAPGGP